MGVVVVVPSGQAPVLQVSVEAGTVPAGAAFSVVGQVRDVVWPVRAGARVSDGSQVVLGDPLAPVNVPVTYRVAWDGGEVVSAAVRRPWAGQALLTDVVGGRAVDLLWQGRDPREPDQRVSVHQVPGRATPVVVMAPVMGAGGVSLTARTSGVHTMALAALAATPSVVALFHNPAHCVQCRRGVCDVALVTVMVLTGVSHSRASRVDVAEREWDLKGQLVAVPEPTVAVAVSTWDAFDAAGLTWDGLDAMGLTWDAFDRVLWEQVGA